MMWMLHSNPFQSHRYQYRILSHLCQSKTGSLYMLLFELLSKINLSVHFLYCKISFWNQSALRSLLFIVCNHSNRLVSYYYKYTCHLAEILNFVSWCFQNEKLKVPYSYTMLIWHIPRDEEMQLRLMIESDYFEN